MTWKARPVAGANLRRMQREVVKLNPPGAPRPAPEALQESSVLSAPPQRFSGRAQIGADQCSTEPGPAACGART